MYSGNDLIFFLNHLSVKIYINKKHLLPFGNVRADTLFKKGEKKYF